MERTFASPDAAKVQLEEDESHRQCARNDEYQGIQIKELARCHRQLACGESRFREARQTLFADIMDVGPGQLEHQDETEEERDDVVGKVHVPNEAQEIERVALLAGLYAEANHIAEEQQDGEAPQWTVYSRDEPEERRRVVHVLHAVFERSLYSSRHAIVPGHCSELV